MVWQPSVNDSREWCSVAVVCLENGPPVPQVEEGWVERPVFNERALAATKLTSKLGLQGARMLGTSALIVPPRTTWNIAESELAGNDWREASGASERVLQTANHWLRTGVIAVGKHPLWPRLAAQIPIQVSSNSALDPWRWEQVLPRTED